MTERMIPQLQEATQDASLSPMGAQRSAIRRFSARLGRDAAGVSSSSHQVSSDLQWFMGKLRKQAEMSLSGHQWRRTRRLLKHPSRIR